MTVPVHDLQARIERLEALFIWLFGSLDEEDLTIAMVALNDLMVKEALKQRSKRAA